MPSQEVKKSIAKFVKAYERYPKLSELSEVGLTRASMRHEFGTFEEFKTYVANVHENYIFDLMRHKHYQKPSKSLKRFIITSAVINAKVHEKFLRNLKVAAKHLDGELLVGLSYDKGVIDYTLDPKLKDEVIISCDTYLNSNISILGVLNSARKVDPSTGLANVGQRSGTIVTFSPKQRLKYVATGHNRLPNAIMSTGAVTLPKYEYKGLMPKLDDYKSNLEHILGAVILEVENDKIYHFRQIRADDDGNFVDNTVYYNNGKIQKMRPSALILGDRHVGETDPVVDAVTFEMIHELNPESIFLHDLFDGASINPHEAGREILLARRASMGHLSLTAELDMVSEDLKKFLSTRKNIYVVSSNHDDFLSRYLEKSNYVKHPYNHIECLELAQALSQGINPLKYAMQKRGVKSNKLTWLGRNDSFKIAGVELAAHGDRGAHGSKGTPNTLEQSFINCVVGHSHTPQIYRGVYIVGTSTGLTPHYGPGYASAWMNTHCVLYPNGQRQLINIIDGKWRL